MKRAFIFVCVLVVLAAAGIAWHGRNVPANTEDKTATTLPTTNIVGVEELMKHVDQYKGPVQIEGVVCSASSEKKMLALIDRREFQECGINGCAEYMLPVQWEGTMPVAKDVVRVHGEVKGSSGKLVFAASQVELAGKEASK